MEPILLFLIIQAISIISFCLFLYILNFYPKILKSISSFLRKITSEKKFNIIIVFTVFILSVTLASILSYYFFSYIDSVDVVIAKKSEFDKWEKSLQIAVSVGTFFGILASIKIYEYTDKRQVYQYTLSLFEKFRDERFSKIRDRAWQVRKKWDKDEKNYKHKLIEASFEKTTEIKASPTPETEQEPLNDPNDKALLKEDIKAVRDLFEFYSNLICYKDIPEALISYRFFYYGWWRPFLYTMAKIHDDKYEINKDLNEIETFDYQRYMDNISYIYKLKQLDEIFGFKGVDEKMIIHDLG